MNVQSNQVIAYLDGNPYCHPGHFGWPCYAFGFSWASRDSWQLPDSLVELLAYVDDLPEDFEAAADIERDSFAYMNDWPDGYDPSA